VVGKTDFDFLPRELAAPYHADEQALIASGEPLRDREEPSIDPDGGPRWLLTTKVPVRDAGGSVVGLVGISHDITQRKLAEELVVRQKEELARSEAALREQTHILQGVLDSIGEGVVVADERGRLLMFNPAAEEILGRGLSDAAPEQWSDRYGT